jgi:hypothetical protein
VCCYTFCNWYISFRLIVCGQWRDITALVREFEEPPIGPGTDCLRVIIDFIGAAVSGMRLGDLTTSCASARCTRYDGMCRLCTAGPLVSVVAIGTASKAATTVL